MSVKNGLIAGFVGSAVLAVAFVMKSAMGIPPVNLDVIKMLSAMMGMPSIVGWLAHFMIGTILWGGLFVLANDLIPGKSQTVKGISLGVVAWLMMMVAVMPMAGAGFFGLNFGIIGAVMPLMLHIIFGAVLGFTYAVLGAGEVKTA
jgi:uncharacterized protein YneF (UPF0154 family)